MAVHIVRGYAGTGKTEYAIHQINEVLFHRPFARIWVILATKRQEFSFRQRLMASIQRPAIFNVEFFDFYTLYQHLLDQADQPQRLLNDSAQLTLLRRLLKEHQAELEHFRPIADTLGFAKVVGDFIFELKQNRMRPEAYLESARTARDRDLANIYWLYQAQLQQHRLVDKEGQGWLAVQSLADTMNTANNIDLLIVDGFDQFTTVQSDLIAQLAKRAVNTFIMLADVPELQRTVGRRFTDVYNQLVARLDQFDVVDLDFETAWYDCHADVTHTANHIFRYPVTAKASDNGIRFIEAPDETSEVSAVFRQVKRLLIAGVHPENIVVAIRNWSAYQSHLPAIQQKYRLPLLLHYSQRLASNPMMVAMQAILSLHANDFRRTDLLSVLRSPYFQIPGFDEETVDVLDRISLLFRVTGTRKRWLTAIEQAITYSVASETTTEEENNVVFDPQMLSEISSHLEVLMDALTPPDEGTPREYISWINQLIGPGLEFEPQSHFVDESNGDLPIDSPFTLNVIECIHHPETPTRIKMRDLQAISAFKRLLANMLSTHELIASLSGDDQEHITWDKFTAELASLIATTEIENSSEREGHVLVTTAANARGLPHKHVFILGLSAGSFPLSTSEDPLYLDQERANLIIGGRPLLTRAERSSDDALFYELVSLANESLTLSRPAHKDGTPRAPSPFWRAVAALFTDSAELIKNDRLKIGEVPQLHDVVTVDEMVVSLASRLNEATEKFSEHDQSAAIWLQQSQPQLWDHIAYARKIEQERLSGYGQYSGLLTHAPLVRLVNEMLSPSHVWSASQLNDYGVCGFRYFAKRLLQLETLDEPDEGMDVAQRGQIIHDILYKTYRDVRSRRYAIAPSNLEPTLAILERHTKDVFNEGPAKYGINKDVLWTYEQKYISDLLNRFVRTDFAVTDENPLHKKFAYSHRTPYLLEQPFGYNDAPVTIDLASAGEIRIHGFIDRIDLVDNDSVIVIDYKTGGAPSLSDLRDGRNFQMLIYLKGVQALLDRDDRNTKIAGGVFWKLNAAEVYSALMPGANPKHEQDMGAGLAALEENIKRGRAGDFRAHANKIDNGRCIRYCEFSQLCRMKHSES